MRFIEGPPTFAVEVRSENAYTPAAEIEIAAKRADYFAAGTLVVWDVDPIAETIAWLSRRRAGHARRLPPRRHGRRRAGAPAAAHCGR